MRAGGCRVPKCGLRAPMHGPRAHSPSAVRTAALTAALIAALTACEGGPPPVNAAGPANASSASRATPSSGPEPRRAASTGAASDLRPAVIWGDIVIEWEEVRPRLAERSGAAVLEELLLDRALDVRLRERGITPGPDAIADEERILRETLDPSPDRAAALLRELRQAQGLGPRRWADLLRRNAAMRALVAEEVRITDEAVDAALDAAHGPKRRCRIIAVPDMRAAEAVTSSVAGGASFADLAVERSTDRSAERGGRIAPVSRLDPSYPAAFRSALWAVEPGRVSPPVLLDQGYVVILCESEVPADAAFTDPAARGKARDAVRRAQERLRMEALARSILRDTNTATVFDDSLQWSWSSTREPAAGR